ncbi:MAG: hypothetical protein AAGI01_15840 [Myxococcota bacterium]
MTKVKVWFRRRTATTFAAKTTYRPNNGGRTRQLHLGTIRADEDLTAAGSERAEQVFEMLEEALRSKWDRWKDDSNISIDREHAKEKWSAATKPTVTDREDRCELRHVT